MNETGKTSFYRNAGIRKHLDAFSLINMPFLVYDPVTGYFTIPDPSGYWDEVCDIGGASDAFNTEVVFVVSQVSEGSNDVAFFITMVVPYADIIANGLVGKKVKALGLKGGVPGRDISAELLPGGNMTSNSTGSSGSQGVDINDFTQGLAYQTTFNGDYTSSVNFNNDLNKTGNSTSENLDKFNGLNANKAMSLAKEGTNGNLVKTVSTTSTATGIAVSARQRLLQNNMVGTNATYSIAYNKFLLNNVSNSFKYAPYVSLGVTIYTGYYLSKTINAATNLPYQSWAESGMDIGANIGIKYLGTQYGGWVGAGTATLYVIDKAAFNAYMNSVKKYPDWVLPSLVHSFIH